MAARKRSAHTVRVRSQAASAPPLMQVGSVVIGVPVVLTAIRCTLQYIIVPFVLPLVGVSAAISPAINMGAGAFSIGVILYNLKTLWDTDWRKRYMLIAAFAIPFVLLSIYFDYVNYTSF
jgi:hypothetical protein